MGFCVHQTTGGRYEWSVFQSAYGAAGGTEESLAAAKVEMAIAEAAICDSPYPPAVVAVMRSDYERFAADWPDPNLGPCFMHDVVPLSRDPGDAT